MSEEPFKNPEISIPRLVDLILGNHSGQMALLGLQLQKKRPIHGLAYFVHLGANASKRDAQNKQ